MTYITILGRRTMYTQVHTHIHTQAHTDFGAEEKANAKTQTEK